MKFVDETDGPACHFCNTAHDFVYEVETDDYCIDCLDSEKIPMSDVHAIWDVYYGSIILIKDGTILILSEEE